jgi:hypothetical protein
MKIINTQRHRTNLFAAKETGDYSQIYFKACFLAPNEAEMKGCSQVKTKAI